MKLITAAIARGLPPLYSTENCPAADIVLKIFGGACTWHITEGRQEDNGDWLLFGLCDLGHGSPELGYVSLRELESVRIPLSIGGRIIARLPLERDLYFDGYELDYHTREVRKKAAATEPPAGAPPAQPDPPPAPSEPSPAPGAQMSLCWV